MKKNTKLTTKNIVITVKPLKEGTKW